MAYTPPNSPIVFTPLDVLTAEELNQLQENINNNIGQLSDSLPIFPLTANNIASNAITSTKIASGAVGANKLDWSAFGFSSTTSNTKVDINTSYKNVVQLDVSHLPSGAVFEATGVANFSGADPIETIYLRIAYGTNNSIPVTQTNSWSRSASVTASFTKGSQNTITLQALGDKSSVASEFTDGYLSVRRVG